MHTSMSLQRGSSASSSSSSFDTSTFEESKEEVLLRSQSPTRLAKGALDNYKKGFSFKGKGIGNTVNKPQEDITGCQCKGDKFGMNCAQEISKAVTYLPYELEQAQLDVKGKIPERLFARDALKQCKTDIDESLASAVDDKVANVNISDAINQPDRGLEAALAAAANLHAHGGERKLASKRAAYAVRISKLYDTVRDPVQCLHGHTFKSYLLYRIPAALDLPGTIAAAALAAQDALQLGKSAQITSTAAAGGVTHEHEAALAARGHVLEVDRVHSAQRGRTATEGFASEYCGNTTGFACHFEPMSTCSMPGHTHAGDDDAADAADAHRLAEFKAGSKMSVLPGEGGGLSSRRVGPKPVMQGAHEHDPSYDVREVPQYATVPDNFAKLGNFWWSTTALRFAARLKPESAAIMERIAEGLGLGKTRAAVGLYLPHCPHRSFQGSTLRNIVDVDRVGVSPEFPEYDANGTRSETSWEVEQALYVGNRKKYKGVGLLNADTSTVDGAKAWLNSVKTFCEQDLEKVLPKAVDLARSLGRGEHKGEAVIYIDTPNADAIAGLNVYEGVRIVHLAHANAKLLARYKASSRLTKLGAGASGSGRHRLDMRTNDPPSEWMGEPGDWRGGHTFGGAGESWGSPKDDWRAALRLARSDASVEELALLYLLAYKCDAILGPMTAPRVRVAYQLAVADRGYYPPFVSTDGSPLGRLHLPNLQKVLPSVAAPPPPPKEVHRVVDGAVRWEGNELELEHERDMYGRKAKLHKDTERPMLAYSGKWSIDDVPMLSVTHPSGKRTYRNSYRRGVGKGFNAHRKDEHRGCFGPGCVKLRG
ncbi:hypothetical protein RI054_15g73550 [Pseudoscourfieldia marina]